MSYGLLALILLLPPINLGLIWTAFFLSDELGKDQAGRAVAFVTITINATAALAGLFFLFCWLNQHVRWT